MKKITTALLLFTLLLGACSNSSTTPESAATQNPAPTAIAAATDSVATESVAIESTVPAREAVISEIENTVSARTSPNADPAPASIGMSIGIGGGIETGSDGRARIDLRPDGTIIRVGPNSSFTVPELIEVNGEPKTTIELFFGKIYILLNGGSLEVKTPTGIASVRGSVLSVQYDPETKRVEASCLEGHCTLENEEGVEVELIEGEESSIDFGELPLDPEQIDSAEIQDWLDEIPEMHDFFDELPNPEDFPEPGPEDVPPDDGPPGDGLPGDGSPRDDPPGDRPPGDDLPDDDPPSG